MKNILLKYMLERFVNAGENIRPIVTITKESGCPSKEIAIELSFLLNEVEKIKNSNIKWRIINKEIIEETAKELNMKPETLSKIFNKEQRSIIDEVLKSLIETNYRSEIKVKKTIAGIVESFAREGHSILINMGAAAILKTYSNSFNVMLFAPLEYRISMWMRNSNIDRNDLVRHIRELDRNNIDLIDSFLGKKSDNSIYDIIINCEKADAREIAEIIFKTMEVKKII